MKNLYQTLDNVFQILSLSKKIQLSDCPVRVTESQIITPIGDVAPVLYKQNSKLNNTIVDLNLLKDLIAQLDDKKSIVRLNHIGFGYRVTSRQIERQRLIHLVGNTDQYLYEEESNDFGLWLFLGNTNIWENPLIEFVPVEADDPQIDYYLPHIQIDIDTILNANEIEKIVTDVSDNTIQPYRVAVIDGITYIVRNRLGVIDGVNIFIDLATNSRNVKFHRQNYLKKIS